MPIKKDLFEAENGSLVRLDLIKHFAIQQNEYALHLTGDGINLKEWKFSIKERHEFWSKPDPVRAYYPGSYKQIEMLVIQETNKIKEEIRSWILHNI